MKKPRKKPRPELRVRIDAALFKALKLAATRHDSTVPQMVTCALGDYHMIRSELKDWAGGE